MSQHDRVVPGFVAQHASAAAIGIVSALVAAVLLVGACLWKYYPPIDAVQQYRIRFGAIAPGTADPLVVTGELKHGDFFYVKYVGPQSVSFGYDLWGHGGPLSAAFAAQPGSTHDLEVTLPSLSATRNNYDRIPGRLRVVVDGRLLIDAPVHPFVRKPTHLWFAANPIGGTSCGAQFRGQLMNAQGTVMTGNVRQTLSRLQRFRGWLRYARWQQLGVAILSILLGLGVARISRVEPHAVRRSFRVCGTLFTIHKAFFFSAVACSAVFVWFETSGSWKLAYPDSFGWFYDFQARSLLQGRLDVPEEALGGEAFIHNAKVYGYFGITPALLRVPFVVLGIGFGRMTRLSQLLAYVACLTGAYLLLLEASRLSGPMKFRPRWWLIVLFTANVGLGSTLLFLGSRAYVYHEAIIWGVAFATFGSWFGLRHLATPRRRSWISSLICGTLSLHARPPTGLFALTFLGCVALVQMYRNRRSPRTAARHAGILILCGFGVASFNALSYLKFGTFEGCPLRMNVQYSTQRLARIDGKEFHLANIPFVFSTYMLEPQLRLKPEFPFVFFGSGSQMLSRAAKMDMIDETVAVPYGMTGLTLLAVIGGAIALCRAPPVRSSILVAWAAALPMTVALCAAIATSERYTADFCPFLMVAAALGAAGLASSARTVRIILLSVLVTATVWSASVFVALTFQYQGTKVWGTPKGTQERYERLRRRVNRVIDSL